MTEELHHNLVLPTVHGSVLAIICSCGSVRKDSLKAVCHVVVWLMDVGTGVTAVIVIDEQVP